MKVHTKWRWEECTQQGTQEGGGEHSIDNYKHESLLAATLPQLTVWNTGLLFS
jgi:hypothetical protein